ncbi:MAG: hypothetical protein ACUVUE_00690 [Candidatus Bathycorpusculaceae bacterium]
MNGKGQFSIIAALLVAVILIATVIFTYSTIRDSPAQDYPQVQSAIDETNLALRQILGFTLGYYGSVLQVTGNTSYARILATEYLYNGLEHVGNVHPEWGTSFVVNSSELNTYWFTNASYSSGELIVTYNLTGIGIYGITYATSCRLDVEVTNMNSSGQACLSVSKDGFEPLINLGKQNFKFYRYISPNSTWQPVIPNNEPIAFANGTYLIDLPSEIDPYSYVVQVEDQRGVIVVASSFSHYVCTPAWNVTSTPTWTQDYVDNNVSDVDLSVDKGQHGNFTAEQYGPDSIWDLLTEENVGGSYVELWSETFKPTTAGTWEVTGLGSYGVPANSVAIIQIYQDEESNVKRDAGVRAVGSSLNRYIPMHEAEAGGVVIVSMMVQVDSNQNIEVYSETIAENTISFRVIGYFTGVTYTEKFENWNPNYGGVWTIKDLYTDYGVPKGSVAEIFLANADTGNERYLGVRTEGSALDRRVLIHESEGGGRDGVTMCVKTDTSSGRIECYNQGTTGHFYLLGYFDGNITYVERMDTLGAANADVWESVTLSTPPSAVVEVLALNDANSAERYGGARATLSSLDRRVLIHEAEAGGLTGGRFSVQSNGSSTIEIYEDSTGDISFALVGYWIMENYQLDLEVQWTTAEYERANEHLCIKTGNLGAETLRVDVWHSNAWHTVIANLAPNTWNNVSVSAYLESNTFTIRFKDDTETGDVTQDSWEIDATLLQTGSLSDTTIIVELLQNGTMRWLGQNLKLTTQAIPIPPIAVKAIHVNQTINGIDCEVPFQIEDWASEYTIPLGLTNNLSIFSGRTMLVFLMNSDVSKVTIWWNGSDKADQTSYAYTNRYFTGDDPSNGILTNGILTLNVDASGDNFVIESTVGATASTVRFMRVNNEWSIYGSDPAYAIHHGIVRDIIHVEPEWSGGADNCPDLYAHIVLTLPATTSYYTYQARTMFVNSEQNRIITDLCPIRLTSSLNQIQTENGTASGFPAVTNMTGLFYNFSDGAWAHHWSQFILETRGTGIMFTDSANQMLYVFDAIAGNNTGALKADSAEQTIELLPITLNQVQFSSALEILWHGAVVTFDETTPIYIDDGGIKNGLWMTVEYPPQIAVTTEG